VNTSSGHYVRDWPRWKRGAGPWKRNWRSCSQKRAGGRATAAINPLSLSPTHRRSSSDPAPAPVPVIVPGTRAAAGCKTTQGKHYVATRSQRFSAVLGKWLSFHRSRRRGESAGRQRRVSVGFFLREQFQFCPRARTGTLLELREAERHLLILDRLVEVAGLGARGSQGTDVFGILNNSNALSLSQVSCRELLLADYTERTDDRARPHVVCLPLAVLQSVPVMRCPDSVDSHFYASTIGVLCLKHAK
jgi:hypothetical protein